MVIKIIIIILLVIYINSIDTYEGVDFKAGPLVEYYDKHGITNNPYLDTLTKNGKSINYFNGLNTISGSLQASNKHRIKQILTKHHIPTPKSYLWEKNDTVDKNLSNITNSLKFPLVIKPIYGTEGNGVFTNIDTPPEIISSVTDIDDEGIILFVDTDKTLYRGLNNLLNVVYKSVYTQTDILIEEQMTGFVHRILIYKNDVIGIVKRYPPTIVGDGVTSLGSLIDKFQTAHEFPVKTINWKNNKLNGYAASDIVPSGVRIILSQTVNYHNGASSENIDVSKVHPANIALFQKINKVVGLDLNGIDYITHDLSIPYYEYGFVIEVNAYPGLISHHLTNPQTLDKLLEKLF